MIVEIISPTVQKFNGESFYLCGNYFQRKGKRLHRTVWQYHNGDIPKGYHVHHIDGNKSNNSIENLALLPGKEHLSNHMKEPERVEKSRQSIHKAVKAATVWHGTSEGAEWHSKHAKEYWASAPMNEYKCDFCGKTFYSRAVRYKGNHFCGGNCKAAFRRRRLKNENKEH